MVYVVVVPFVVLVQTVTPVVTAVFVHVLPEQVVRVTTVVVAE